MFTTVEHFEKAFLNEAEGTQKIMDALTDDSLLQPVADGHWNLGRTAWHIVGAYSEVMSRTGLEFSTAKDDVPVPKSAEGIKTEYAKATKELLEQVKTGWDDATLQTEDDMYGEKWKRGTTLAILLNHEVHHRGQMTVLMRQAGLRVPGVYGPAKEDWAQYNMQPPE